MAMATSRMNANFDKRIDKLNPVEENPNLSNIKGVLSPKFDLEFGDIIEFPAIGKEKYIVVELGAFDVSDTFSDAQVKSNKEKGVLFNIEDGSYFGKNDLEKAEIDSKGRGYKVLGYFDKYKELIPVGSTITDDEEQHSDLYVQMYGYCIVKATADNKSTLLEVKEELEEDSEANFFDHFYEEDVDFLPYDSPLEISKVGVLFKDTPIKVSSTSNSEHSGIIVEEDLSIFTEEQVAYIHMIDDFKDYIKNKFLNENGNVNN